MKYEKKQQQKEQQLFEHNTKTSGTEMAIWPPTCMILWLRNKK